MRCPLPLEKAGQPHSGTVIAGDSSGRVHDLRLQGIDFQERPARVTAVRLFLFDSMRRRWWLFGKKKGRWDDNITAICRDCGARLLPSSYVLDAIRAIARSAGLEREQSGCLELPSEAWEVPQLLSKWQAAASRSDSTRSSSTIGEGTNG